MPGPSLRPIHPGSCGPCSGSGTSAAAATRPAMPPDPPAPRTALGLLLLSTLGALEEMGLVPTLGDEMESAAESLDRAAASVSPEAPEEGNDAKRVARFVGDRMPVIWGEDGI